MIKYLLNRPIAVCIITLSFSILGILAFFQLPITLLPNIPVPEIMVQASYPLAQAREMQRIIEQPLRNQLLQINHLENIESTSQNGLSILTLRFPFGTNTQLAYLEINEKIDAILNQLPEDFQRPKVIKASAGDIPVFNLNVLPNSDYKGEFIELSEFTENIIKRRIEQLSEVAIVDITGLTKPEVLIQADAGKLVSLGLSEQKLANILNESNVEPGNLSLKSGPYQYNIHFSSSLRTVEDVENIKISIGGTTNAGIIAQNDPRVSYFADNVLNTQNNLSFTPKRIISLREIASVKIVEQQNHGTYYFNGKRGICLSIIKQSDAQLLRLRKKLNILLNLFKKDYPQIEFSLSQDQTELLDISVNNLFSNIITGALLTFGMIFLFMRDWRLPLIIGIVIPISISITFLSFFLLGMTLNIVSLAGLVLGMGEIIDSSIIIIENIEEKRDQKMSVEDSCIIGVKEVIRPLFTSILTNSAVFLPLLFLSGIAGALFFDQSVSVSLSLGVSLLCSYILIPVLYNFIFKNYTIREKASNSTFIMIIIEKIYSYIFSYSFRFRYIFITSVCILLLGTFWVLVRIKKQGMPEISHTELEISVNWNEPISVDENNIRVNDLLNHIKSIPVYVSSFVGQQQFLLNRSIIQNENESLLSIRTDSPQKYTQIIDSLFYRLQFKSPNSISQFRPALNVFEQLFGFNTPSFLIKLHNINGSYPLEPSVIERLIKKFNMAKITVDPIPIQNQLSISLIPERLILYNVDENILIQKLKSVLNNFQVSNIHFNQGLAPISISGDKSQLNLNNTLVYNNKNQLIPVKQLINISSNSDNTIFYSDKEGVYTPILFPERNGDMNYFQEKVNSILKSEPDILYNWSGTYFQNQSYIDELMLVILVAISLLFCILTAQFESFMQPLIILVVICLGISGALWTLYLFGNSINIFSIIGIVVLIGLLDNDTILKIDTINKSIDSMTLMESIYSAGLRRLKSQIMTFLTTVLGLIPVIFFGGLGSELQKPLALAVIGGMSFGVLASWTITPLFYLFIAGKK